jgi:hypothetical protein
MQQPDEKQLIDLALAEHARLVLLKQSAPDADPTAVDTSGAELETDLQKHQGQTYVILREADELAGVYWYHDGKMELATNYPASFE